MYNYFTEVRNTITIPLQLSFPDQQQRDFIIDQIVAAVSTELHNMWIISFRYGTLSVTPYYRASAFGKKDVEKKIRHDFICGITIVNERFCYHYWLEQNELRAKKYLINMPPPPPPPLPPIQAPIVRPLIIRLSAQSSSDEEF